MREKGSCLFDVTALKLVREVAEPSARTFFRMDETVRLIEAEIPRLRRYARALLRDEDRAHNLVQDTLDRGLHKFHLYHPSIIREPICALGSSRSCTTSMSTPSAVPSGRARRSSCRRCHSRRRHRGCPVLSSGIWSAPSLDSAWRSERRCCWPSWLRLRPRKPVL
jgi:hypothetical protein